MSMLLSSVPVIGALLMSALLINVRLTSVLLNNV